MPRRLPGVLGAVLLAAGCVPSSVTVAPHSTASHLSFDIKGSASHLEVVACSDTSHVIWAADAKAGSLGPRVRFDSSQVLSAGCYLARTHGARRYFDVHDNGLVVQQI